MKDEVGRYSHIPEELAKEKAWVNVWNHSKIPMQTRIALAASVSRPDTWGHFRDAVMNVEDGTLDGIGYIFHDTGLVGIDIDRGYDVDGSLSETAKDIITACKSYTEQSRSGRGFHILLRGSLPFDGKNNRKGVEIYKTRRFFIMTGEVCFWFSKIVENQTAIDYVVKNYFPETVKEDSSPASTRIYSPIYPKPSGGKIYLQPTYPPIQQGGRNISLASLAGQMHSAGCSKKIIYKELLRANAEACKPPLKPSEIESIVNSITRYKR